MKYQDAKNAIPKFNSLIGKPTNDSVITEIYVSYIEKSLAKQHYELTLMGVVDNYNEKYEGSYTLWAKLADETICPVKQVISTDKVEDLYSYAELLD